nr:class I SAM-dependent methyltransferase [Clostridia bacterium]
MYTSFAEVYDQLMDNVDYERWADLYREILTGYGVPMGKVCECACGTGGLTIPLNRRGYQMTGVDLSQEMLWIAAQKARRVGLGIPFVQQDMRKLRLHRQMDAVIATCDGVNYLLEDKDVLAFFTAAFAAIRPGGALVFDISTPWKLEHMRGDQILCEDRPQVTYMWQNRFDKGKGLLDMHLCIFVRQKDGSYRRIDEEQRQRAHTIQSLTGLLTAAGFTNIRAFGNSRMEAPREGEQRWHIAAMKPQAE